MLRPLRLTREVEKIWVSDENFQVEEHEILVGAGFKPLLSA
jgi:hypothetical protein